ncbi:bifunctional diaminohydroxyphosphoribosylaminopyrimidine deaminase/5-amino-6-(5-phosphoribosylamino)uracil reductase RibD [Candidatus Thioglobus sp.]|jgi:diaminohydroxyphosphoribosylaminopyrimidine deaminase (EC 3.5.4.26)/5-amino-6-(5-phosphoribosylamino)uracil reductase (EC 1.1.1.193)|uniref:bifunctional diaminohydroxyphosphoribosylaminopyrimidine deaminase/5-amino-6-(5-phosphoribosylamino)uracil reductase RibD n=1 Tax=Candidatus Thioglobus sp. TaxID=2026721 RepID=UPI00176222A0|nr:bifunctional diaminohydroxyphosphoribosylaminopyrimidine deaminase/5-amino-6-(5-phosphoribosylamino)uracil reductase RibD [Candidatus Thioglobus sp.]
MSSTFSKNDSHYMAIALKLASKGIYGVKSNPMVGCVIVKDDKIIAKGHHKTFGEAHAEINALKQIDHQANEATLFITLEPCSHQGKTPPCAQAIIDSGAKKVIIAMLDPNPLVSSKGVSMLENAGIEVLIGLMENEALELNRGFVKRMQIGRPFVTCKIAMSLDGKTSMKSGESKWITAEPARQDVQYLRANHQAIVTGSGTVIDDNPAMTVRLNEIDSSPLRVVIDGKDQIQDKSLNIFSGNAPTLILNAGNTKMLKSGKLDLDDALKHLGDQGINNALLEAGPGLVGAMIEAKLIDRFVIYTAPILMGSDANSMANLAFKNMNDKIKLNIQDIRMVGDDIKITATI